MYNLQNRLIAERYKHLLNAISSERFLKMQGLGNEVPFFICPFHPQEHDEMQRNIASLSNALNNRGIRVLNIDLYELSIELLKKRGIWERVLENEAEMSKAELKELLQSVLDPEHHLIPAINEKMDEGDFDVMFISGVGEVFPYIRSHTVLNNLQSTAKDKPTVMFFPGEYIQSLEEGASLDLFGKIHDDKYYRAFNIYLYQV
ncbi:MAG: DUF1788 domain-containing protein [Anaerolineae bacterium]|jgi:hypothetical protein|nr:DUF1788 domain-containing protein [Anaerolineae bacterium]MBT7189545.1 DUF1788 domain-containing protein [Anaerolineae bacterium]